MQGTRGPQNKIRPHEPGEAFGVRAYSAAFLLGGVLLRAATSLN